MNTLSVIKNNGFERLVNEIFESAQNQKTGFSPACEIKELSESYTINFEVPGVDPSQIDIEVLDRVLHIKGQKKNSYDEQSSKPLLSELKYGEFRRSFSLPENANVEDVSADYKSGILSLKISKLEPMKAKKIRVKNLED